MSNLVHYAALGAALVAGTAAAHAQTVIMQEPYVAPAYAAPGYVAPGYVATAPIVTPAPNVVIAQPAPAPVAQEIVTQPQTIVTQPRERVQETVIERSDTQPIVRHRARTTRVHLTGHQRREVMHTIRYERAPATQERIATTTPVSYSVGSVLPATVATYALPRQAVYEAPGLQGYAYAPVGNRVLLVEPASNVVVDELD